jgi:hypothetical protein
MSNVEKVKQLLDGTLDPAELELDADLYSMAERIYGREALEEMGVSAPERGPDTIIEPNGDSSHDVQIPSPMPLPAVNGSQKSGRDWVRGLLLISGLLGFLTVLYNTFFGIGEIYEFCINTSGTSGVCGSTFDWPSLLNPSSSTAWSEPGSINVQDAVLLTVTLLVSFIGLRWKSS